MRASLSLAAALLAGCEHYTASGNGYSVDTFRMLTNSSTSATLPGGLSITHTSDPNVQAIQAAAQANADAMAKLTDLVSKLVPLVVKGAVGAPAVAWEPQDAQMGLDRPLIEPEGPANAQEISGASFLPWKFSARPRPVSGGSGPYRLDVNARSDSMADVMALDTPPRPTTPLGKQDHGDAEAIDSWRTAQAGGPSLPAARALRAGCVRLLRRESEQSGSCATAELRGECPRYLIECEHEPVRDDAGLPRLQQLVGDISRHVNDGSQGGVEAPLATQAQQTNRLPGLDGRGVERAGANLAQLYRAVGWNAEAPVTTTGVPDILGGSMAESRSPISRSESEPKQAASVVVDASISAWPKVASRYWLHPAGNGLWQIELSDKRDTAEAGI